MLVRRHLATQILAQMALVTAIVERKQLFGAYDENLTLEFFVRDLCNLAFSWQLSHVGNLATDRAIDLADPGQKIALQVSARQDWAVKVEETLTAFSGAGLAEQYPQLIIFFLQEELPVFFKNACPRANHPVVWDCGVFRQHLPRLAENRLWAIKHALYEVITIVSKPTVAAAPADWASGEAPAPGQPDPRFKRLSTT